MLKAATIGLHTGRHSHIFDDELQRTVAKHEFPTIPDGEIGWFIRTERVSLKYVSKTPFYGISLCCMNE